MKLLILYDSHPELGTFEVAKALDYDVVVLAGDIVALRPRRSRDRREALPRLRFAPTFACGLTMQALQGS
ncbi:hypothetical protein SAMN05216567_12588 [Variovorax sp. OK605]|uniref:hypothetical protein n=1 Tax=Variovorax sp. OK605 TaxID=1855317 RepID=UPI0008EC8605|nr:hypothetical protein [Variovorax sp. OK605]SFQ67558.1 hypothetical protein SAMN05216567_12588 [Variovorax sp. OK605]